MDRSNTPLTTVNTAVFAPIPRASVSIATPVNPGFLRSMRVPKRRSCTRLSTKHTHAAQESGIYRRGSADAGPWDWREHGGIHGGQRSVAAIHALPRSGSLVPRFVEHGIPTIRMAT